MTIPLSFDVWWNTHAPLEFRDSEAARDMVAQAWVASRDTARCTLSEAGSIYPGDNGLGSGTWIGVDLDATAAFFDTYRGPEHIGDPIPAMKARIMMWLAEGKDVRMFTARVDGGHAARRAGNPSADAFADVARIVHIIQSWTKHHFGQRLTVTNVKDCMMDQIWDDKAIRVEANTGIPALPGMG